MRQDLTDWSSDCKLCHPKAGQPPNHSNPPLWVCRIFCYASWAQMAHDLGLARWHCSHVSLLLSNDFHDWYWQLLSWPSSYIAIGIIRGNGAQNVNVYRVMTRPLWFHPTRQCPTQFIRVPMQTLCGIIWPKASLDREVSRVECNGENWRSISPARSGWAHPRNGLNVGHNGTAVTPKWDVC